MCGPIWHVSTLFLYFLCKATNLVWIMLNVLIPTLDVLAKDITKVYKFKHNLKLTWTVIYYCKRQHYIFYIEPLSKTGYWLGVCHGWFHLQGLTRGVKNASRVRITKLKILVHCGIQTPDLPFTKRTRYHWATKTDENWVVKRSPGFYLYYFLKLTCSTC